MTVGQLEAYCRPLYPTWDDDFANELREQFALDSRVKLKPLSRGMQIKAALVVSLAYRPKLLILDEPFPGLDPAVRDDLVRGVLAIADQAQWTVLLEGVNGAMLIAEVLVFYFAVSLVVHGDPLVGSRAFWLTRPIAPRSMFAAKLLVLIVLLVLIPVVLNAGRLATYGAPAGAVAAASAQVALSRLTWVTLAWLVAAVTASTVAFFLVFAGAIAAVMAYLAIYASVSMQLAQRQFNRFYVPPVPLSDDTPTYLASLVLVGLGLAVIRLQYGVRRWTVSAPLSLAVLVLAGVALGSRSTAVAMATPPKPPSWLTDPATTSIRLTGTHAPAHDGVTPCGSSRFTSTCCANRGCADMGVLLATWSENLLGDIASRSGRGLRCSSCGRKARPRGRPR
jgi:hypothetical protein